MSPFLLRRWEDNGEGVFYNLTVYTAYFLFVCVFLFFCLMLARDVIWFGLHLFSKNIVSPFQEPFATQSNIGLTIFVFLLSGIALWSGTKVPEIKEISLYSEKIVKPIKLAVLSDIHIHRALSENKLKEIIERTNSQKPDVILLPGDIIDDNKQKITHLVPYLGKFQAPLGVFVTDGNHEVYIGQKNTTPQFLSENLIYLNNDSHLIRPDIRIAGVPDIQANRFNNRPDMKKALADKTTYTVLLAHSPKMFNSENNTADLQVSGHTHGGQIFPFHFLAKLSNKYLSGLYRLDNRTLYVSRGAGQWGPQMRLFSPSEITIITLYPKK